PWSDKDDEGMGFYKNDFEPDNIYIICPSTLVDHKWQTVIKGKEIPESNIYDRYVEEEVEALYNRLEQQYYDEVERGEKPSHKLIVMDDVSFGGSLKDKVNGVIAKLACQGRHHLISFVFTTQKYSDVLTTVRENASGMILFGCSRKQQELIYNDIGETEKKEFMDMFRRATHQKHSFMVCNYSNDPDKRFLDQHFQPLQ
ncbi:MAG: ATPase/DNA packaging protein, partial [Promethearchaeota archaeon]